MNKIHVQQSKSDYIIKDVSASEPKEKQKIIKIKIAEDTMDQAGNMDYGIVNGPDGDVKDFQGVTALTRGVKSKHLMKVDLTPQTAAKKINQLEPANSGKYHRDVQRLLKLLPTCQPFEANAFIKQLFDKMMLHIDETPKFYPRKNLIQSILVNVQQTHPQLLPTALEKVDQLIAMTLSQDCKRAVSAGLNYAEAALVASVHFQPEHFDATSVALFNRFNEISPEPFRGIRKFIAKVWNLPKGPIFIGVGAVSAMLLIKAVLPVLILSSVGMAAWAVVKISRKEKINLKPLLSLAKERLQALQAYSGMTREIALKNNISPARLVDIHNEFVSIIENDRRLTNKALSNYTINMLTQELLPETTV